MKIKVKAYPIFKEYVEIETKSNISISELIRLLDTEYPEFREYYLDKDGNLDIEVVIVHNGKQVKDYNTVLADGDVVTFIPPVAGGYTPIINFIL
jgi:MoaD family protein